MKIIPEWLAVMIYWSLVRRIDMFKPDQTIGGSSNPYMKRWFLSRDEGKGRRYLHHILRADDDRALHDHPWWNISIVLIGGYVEVEPRRNGDPVLIRKWRGPGSVVFRRASQRHRIELPDPEFPDHPVKTAPLSCWSLFITGPKSRDWGFWCSPSKWVHWRDFTSDHIASGKGCQE